MRTHVKHSLTLKHLGVVSAITLVSLALFLVIQFFYLLEQRKEDYLSQLGNAAVQIQTPLMNSLLGSDLPEIKRLLISLRMSGILGEAVITQSGNTVMALKFATPKTIPNWAVSLFDIPVSLTLPLYAYGNTTSLAKPLGYLTLYVDSNRIYRFVLKLMTIMVTMYLLLSLVITIAVTWSASRIIVRPLRKMGQTLNQIDEVDHLDSNKYHRNDEIGLLAKGYNLQMNKKKRLVK